MLLRLRNVASTHIKHRKLGQDGIKLLLKRVLCKLDLSHIKIPYPTDFEVFVDDLGIYKIFETEEIRLFDIPLVSFVVFLKGQCQENRPLWALAQWP